MTDQPTTQELRVEQVERELSERTEADTAEHEAARDAAERRADKAAYLRRKLEEQQRADRQHGE